MSNKEAKWAYEIRCINHGMGEMNVITEMVEKGYRLVSVAPYEGGNALYFEREKKSEQ